jgi:hypothetical protein
MNGELAELIALACHGTAWLQSDGEAPELFGQSSTFQFVRTLAFLFDPRRRLRRRTETHTTRSWLQDLKARRVSEIRLDVRSSTIGSGRGPLPAHLASAFGNGGSWSLLAMRGRGAELWRASWSVAPGERPPDNRIWDVTYSGFPLGTVHMREPIDLIEARAGLSAVLSEIEHFARDQELDTWAAWFREALQLAEAADPRPPYHEDLLPTGSPLATRQLMAMAVRSWVFGGTRSSRGGCTEPFSMRWKLRRTMASAIRHALTRRAAVRTRTR